MGDAVAFMFFGLAAHGSREVVGLDVERKGGLRIALVEPDDGGVDVLALEDLA